MWLLVAACAELEPGIEPQPFPERVVTGISFPEPSEAVTAWRATADEAAMSEHGWGLWAGVTHETDEVWGGQRLKVYETWRTPSDLACAPGRTRCAIEVRPLTAPGQLQPVLRSMFRVTVAYDPVAFEHALQEDLMNPATLAALPQPGAYATIPPFPDEAIVLKPAYQVVPADQSFLRLSVWTGPDDRPEGYPTSAWPSCVWVDLSRTVPSERPAEVLSDLEACHTPELADTPLDDRYVVPVGDFLSFSIPGTDQAPDSVALLVALHLTTRETDSWTWQTWWWAPDPDEPPSPSSAGIASARPARLTGSARHYAMCTANQMLIPDQPNTGGDPDAGEPVICYNPYLEAHLSNEAVPMELAASDPSRPAVGVHTNCMSCHLLASHTGAATVPTAGADGVGTAARYVDLEDPVLADVVTLDTLFTVGQVADGNALTLR